MTWVKFEYPTDYTERKPQIMSILFTLHKNDNLQKSLRSFQLFSLHRQNKILQNQSENYPLKIVISFENTFNCTFLL